MRPSADDELELIRAKLAGQYRLEHELGRGGMGVVYLARDERLDRPVALKVLPAALARDPATRTRFLREARLAAQLAHPHIVPVYRADELDGLAFFAMGYVDGETLGARIRDRGGLAPEETVRILRECAWALAYAHARGIVHRDVKPENILLERLGGRAVVTDFGIARSNVDPALTMDGHVLGTVHFMSPEQCTGAPLDGRSDLYALGVTGYLALSGRLPFEGESPEAVIVAHATRAAPSLRTVAPAVPAALAAVIDRCLLKDPAARFATGEALADALMKALEADAAASGAAARVLATGQAHAVWRRAAQLQAEAATRLEARLRDDAAAPQPAGPAPATREPVPTSGVRLQDVAAAAVEAGISAQYVALALAELERSPEALARADQPAGWANQLAAGMLGVTERTLAVTRTIRVPPRETLAAIGRTLQAHPFSLTLRDTLGGHPLDGGVLVFTLPPLVDGTYKWTYTAYGLYAREVRVTLRPAVGDPDACDVTIAADHPASLTGLLAAYGAGVSGVAAFGAGAGLLLGLGALSLSGAMLALPALGAGAVAGVLGWRSVAPMHRWGLRKVRREFEDALVAVGASVRALDIFGEAPPAARPRPTAGVYDFRFPT